MSDLSADPLNFLQQASVEGRTLIARTFTEKSAANGLGAGWEDLFSQAWQVWFGLGESLLEIAGAPQDDARDKRFAGQAWREDKRFAVLQRSYRTYAHFMQRAVDSAPVDDNAKGQLRFVTRQVIDAMSPANFLATNPEAIQLALETQGQSLARGVELFLRDASKGRISMSDENAFVVGKNLATTEGAVIYENPLMQLIMYRPLTKKVAARPLLMIPPCINKFYILDLQPENSLVRYALTQGQTVFMLSWRNITPELDTLHWHDYLHQGVIKAIDVVCDVAFDDGATGSLPKQINTLGFCIGGALLSSAAAMLAARGRQEIASMTLLTTLLDYTDAGEIGLLINESSVIAREQSIGQRGIMRAKELGMSFASLRANDLIWPYVVNGYLKGQSPEAFDLLYWNADGTNLPGPMFAWYLRHTYLENNLRRPDHRLPDGSRIDLRQISAPTYVYASKEDHLVPWHTSFESTKILSAPTTFVLGSSGHIAGVINPPAHGKRNYWVDGQSAESASAWLKSANSHTGSWWPHWAAWLKQNSGGMVPARKVLGNHRYPPTEAAPGSYVQVRCD